MSNYTPEDVHTLIENHIEVANKNEISNLGGSSGQIFLDLCGFFKKHLYLETRKANPTAFETEQSIASMQRIVKVCGATNTGAIDSSKPLGRTGRGSQAAGWWWDSSESKVKFTGGLVGTYFIVYLPKFSKPADETDDLLVEENNDEFIVAYFDRLIELWNFKGAGVNRINLTDATLNIVMARYLEDVQPVATAGIPTNSHLL